MQRAPRPVRHPRLLSSTQLGAVTRSRGVAGDVVELPFLLATTSGIPALVDLVLDDLVDRQAALESPLSLLELEDIVDRIVSEDYLPALGSTSRETATVLAVAGEADVESITMLVTFQTTSGVLAALQVLPVTTVGVAYGLPPALESSLLRILARQDRARLLELRGQLAIRAATSGHIADSARWAALSLQASVAREVIMADWRVLVTEHGSRLTQLALSHGSEAPETPVQPGLLLALAYGARYGAELDNPGMLAMLERARRALDDSQPGNLALLIAIETALQLALCATGDFAAAIQRAPRVEALIDRLPPDRELYAFALIGEWKIRHARSRVHNAELAAATTLLVEGIGLLRSATGSTTALVEGLGQLAIIQAFESQLDESRASTRRAESLMEDWHAGSIVEVGLLTARAAVEIELARLDEAELTVGRLTEAARGSEYVQTAISVAGLLDLMLNRPLRGLERFATAASSAPSSTAPGNSRSITLQESLLVRAKLLIALGRLPGAEALLGEFVATDGLMDHTRQLRARIDIARGNPRAALELLSDGATVPRRQLLEHSLLRASALFALGRRPEAEEELFGALALATLTGARRAFYQLMNPLLAPLLNQVDPATAPAEISELLLELQVGTAWPSGRPAITALTTREGIVLDSLDSEATIEAIARKLFVSPETLKSQLRSLYRKLGATNRHEAVQIARQLGLLAA